MAPALRTAPRNAWPLSGLALLVFGLGLAVYAAGRDTSHLLLLGPLQALGAPRLPLPAWLRDAGPSFAHTFAFALLACAWLARTRRQALVAGGTAWALDLLLEGLQHAPVQALLGPPGWLRALVAGTFDPLDLAASTLGLLAAWAVLAFFGGWRAAR